jgi:hypothetical protein
MLVISFYVEDKNLVVGATVTVLAIATTTTTGIIVDMTPKTENTICETI